MLLKPMPPDLKALAAGSTNRRQAGAALLLGAVILLVLMYLTPSPVPPPDLKPVPVPPDPFAHISLSAKAAIVYDLSSKASLYELHAETQLPLASLTKLLTLYAASEALIPQTPILISMRAIREEGDSGLKEGETFAFVDLARLALVASSNDAAEAVAEAAEARRSLIGVDLLASAAESVGLSQTYAVNDTGLDVNAVVSGGYGSARDVALLAGAFLSRTPVLAEATVASSVTAISLQGKSHTLKNTNPGVDTLPGLLLSKTGYTELAGGNLVVIFDAGIGHPVAIAVLGATRESRFTDVETLMRATSAHFAGVAL